MDYDPIPICVYHGGTIIQDSNGCNYKGRKPNVFHANPNIEFSELKEKIFSLTGWLESTCDLGINARWQAGRGSIQCFVLIPITDDDSLRSLIRNTQGGKIDWSLVELYVDKLSKGAEASAVEEEELQTMSLANDCPIDPEYLTQVDCEVCPSSPENNLGSNASDPNQSRGVLIGEVGRIVTEERQLFEEARVNNNIIDNDEGEEAYPEEEDEEEVPIFTRIQGVNHFRRSTLKFFMDAEVGFANHRGGEYGVSNNRSDNFYVGQIFESRDHLKNAAKEWHISHLRECITDKSSPTMYTVRCKEHGRCPWRLHASYSKRSRSFKVKTLVGPHICMHANLRRDHRQLSSAFISRYIIGVVKKQLGTTPARIVEIIKGKFNYNIPYGKAWSAKTKALRHLFGGWKEAYAMLPRLICAIQSTNHGTGYKEWSDCTNVDGTRILRGFFWAFGPAIQAFNSCRPLLSIDGTFLYGKYKGCLLIAIAVDANGQLLPIAYALVEGESIATWTWFMNSIRELVTQREGICVISDRHPGIVNVFNDRDNGWAPPMAYHRWCMRHLAQNLFSAVKNKDLKEDLEKTCCENQKCKFIKRKKELEKNRAQVTNFLKDKPLPKWSLAHDYGGRRYGMMTTNISKVYNKVLKGVRGLPVAAIMELTFYRTNEYFKKRRVVANALLAKGQVWVDEINIHIEMKREKALRHNVRDFDQGRGLYEIITPVRWIEGSRKGGRTHTVNLEKGECTCQKPQLLHYPCSHMLAAYSFMTLDYTRFISRYYSVQYLAHTWAPVFQPMPDVDYWDEYNGPTYIPDETLKHVKRGRRKSKRIRNDMDEMEKAVNSCCGNCREVGHNVRKCPLRFGPRGPSNPEA